MKHFAILLVSLISLCANVKDDKKNPKLESEFTVEFLVIDAFTEEPIPAAQINIKQYNLQTYTDFDGIAKIEHVKSGRYDLEISFASYKKKQLKAYQLNRSNSKITVKLQP